MAEKPSEVDESWLKFEEDDEAYLCDIAENTMDRAALALKGKTVLYLIYN